MEDHLLSDTAENPSDRLEPDVDQPKIEPERGELLGEFEDSPEKESALSAQFRKLLHIFSGFRKRWFSRGKGAAKATAGGAEPAPGLMALPKDSTTEGLALPITPAIPEEESRQALVAEGEAPPRVEPEGEADFASLGLGVSPPEAAPPLIAEDDQAISQFLQTLEEGDAGEQNEGGAADEDLFIQAFRSSPELEEDWQPPFTLDETNRQGEVEHTAALTEPSGDEMFPSEDIDFSNIFIADREAGESQSSLTGLDELGQEEAAQEQEPTFSVDEYWISDQWRRELAGEEVEPADLWQPLSPGESEAAPWVEEEAKEPPETEYGEDVELLDWSDLEQADLDTEPDWIELRRELVGEPEVETKIGVEQPSAAPAPAALAETVHKPTLKELIASLTSAQRALLLSLLILDLAIVALVSASYISAAVNRARAQNQPTSSLVEPVVYPVGIELTGGWYFPLEKGYLQDGKWEPKTAEWLVGTEVRRVIAIPWSKQSEAVISTLEKGDVIRLVMSNKENKNYRVESVEHVQRSQVDVLTDTRPSLVIILYQDRSDERWIVICQP